jgi:hypothetical protein
MAMPVTPTPILKGKDAAKFVENLNKYATQRVSLIPTPKLARLAVIVKKNAT